MFIANYNTVNENSARLSKEMSSFGDYVAGSATNSQRECVDNIVTYANNLLAKNPTSDSETLEKAQHYIDAYSRKVAEAIDKKHAIDCRCPSVMISGGSNFPVAKKNKQIQAWDALYRETADLWYTDDRNYYYKKIRLLLADSGAIMSDDKHAVDKIKAKIAKLETMPDKFGNNKAEIRRLKGRLLELSPNEVKAGKQITINGMPATYENIIKLFDDFKPRKSMYSPESDEYYLNICLEFSDGSRKYKGYLSNQVNEDATQISTYGNRENNYQAIWKPLDDRTKFNLVLGQINGSGNKAVIYSILKDLKPETQSAEEAIATEGESQTERKINGERVTIVSNAEISRLQLMFESIPAQETRNILKSNGFKWAPSQKAWQRLLNENAKSAVRRISAAV